MVKILSIYVDPRHPCCIFEPKSSTMFKVINQLKSALEDQVNFGQWTQLTKNGSMYLNYMFFVHRDAWIGPLRHLGLGSNFSKRTSSFCTSFHLSHVTKEYFHFLHDVDHFFFLSISQISSSWESGTTTVLHRLPRLVHVVLILQTRTILPSLKIT